MYSYEFLAVVWLFDVFVFSGGFWLVACVTVLAFSWLYLGFFRACVGVSLLCCSSKDFVIIATTPIDGLLPALSFGSMFACVVSFVRSVVVSLCSGRCPPSPVCACVVGMVFCAFGGVTIVFLHVLFLPFLPHLLHFTFGVLFFLGDKLLVLARMFS